MKKWFKNNVLYLIGLAVGALAGYPNSYPDWQKVGCLSGACMITSKQINRTLYGALIGALLPGIFNNENKKEIIKEGENSHDI